MVKSKKVKTLKKVSTVGIAKFLVMALVLGGGLVYGTQMVQKNQENRSNAAGVVITYKATADEYGGGTKIDCSKIGGKCGDFAIVWKDGTTCQVGSVTGIIYPKRCDGRRKVKCCAPSSSSTQPTPTTKKSYTAKEYKLGTNKKCSSIGGKCGDFNEVPPANASCTVGSTTGLIYLGKCDGDKTVQCCASKTSTPTSTPTPTKTVTKPKVDGICSTTKKDTCIKGKYHNLPDSKYYFWWECLGLDGGKSSPPCKFEIRI